MISKGSIFTIFCLYVVFLQKYSSFTYPITPRIHSNLLHFRSKQISWNSRKLRAINSYSIPSLSNNALDISSSPNNSNITSNSIVAVESSFEPPYPLNQAQVVYMVMSSIFVTCLLVADIVGVKVFEITLPVRIFGFKTIEHTCGMLTFPLTFVLSDTINEYYGPEATRRTVYIGLWMSVLVFFVVNIAQALPYLNRPFNVTPAAFNMIFGSAKLLYVASLCAYLVGQLSDIWLFGLIKRWTKGRYLWLRAGVSTIISQLLDSFMVSYFAFRLGKQLTNQVPATVQEIINISITGYGLKFIAAAVVTPLMYFLRDLLQNKYKLKPLPATYGMK